MKILSIPSFLSYNDIGEGREMKEIIQAITREDIYKFGVPILTAILAGIPGIAKVYFDRDKYWKCVKQKSSQSNYIIYFWKLYISGFWIVIIYFFLLLALTFALQTNVFVKNVIFWHSIFSGAFHAALVYWIGKPYAVSRKIVYKKRYKHEKLMTNLFAYSPIVMSGLIWAVLVALKSKWLSGVIMIVCVVVEILAMIVLDDESTVMYQYATFHLNDDTIIKWADMNSTCQKGNWIIAKFKDKDSEVRFRQKDIKRIQYSN